jgi:hypothetical protein
VRDNPPPKPSLIRALQEKIKPTPDAKPQADTSKAEAGPLQVTVNGTFALPPLSLLKAGEPVKPDTSGESTERRDVLLQNLGRLRNRGGYCRCRIRAVVHAL